MARIAMLGSGFIARFYTRSLHAQRSRDQVQIVYARKEETGKKFAAEFNIPKSTTSMAEAINDPEVDAVVIALPNNLHLEAVLMVAKAGKAVLCTKPLGCTGEEAQQ
ncbi:MAG: Gfo/Idh/MocA family oxidoreductase, partial [Bacteroidota bacterium]|nr:Gfo/Idh/MocA family oxidoreductase [Bacteroidota bacterium]